jgi:hypothetical protein
MIVPTPRRAPLALLVASELELLGHAIARLIIQVAVATTSAQRAIADRGAREGGYQERKGKGQASG